MRSRTLQDSPIVFPVNGFRWYATIALVVSAVVVLLVTMIFAAIVYGSSQHLSFYATARALTGMPAVFVQGIAEVAVIAYVLLVLPAVAKTPLAGIGFRKLSSAQFGAVALAAILMFVIVTPIASILQTALHFKTPEEAIALFGRAAGWQRAAFAFFGVVLAPAFEEVIFRLVLFNAMRKWWGLWPGAVVSSILFGLAHAQAPWTPAMFACITLPLAVGGLILCLIYVKTNNAWSNILTHGAFNGFSLVLLLLFPQLAK